MNLSSHEYSFLVAAVFLIFAGIRSFLKMSSQAISLTQHFIVGIVFAAVATEIFPKILEVHSPIHSAIRFSLGVAVMVRIKTIPGRIETSDQFPWGLLFRALSLSNDLKQKKST